MIFSIAKRELYDNMMSLRFALTVLLMLIVMVANAVVSLGKYNEQIGDYHRNVAHELKEMQLHAELYPVWSCMVPVNSINSLPLFRSVQTAEKPFFPIIPMADHWSGGGENTPLGSTASGV